MILANIKSFRDKQKKLSDALQEFEGAELKTLDAEMSAILEEIYAHSPKNMGEFRSLMAFFLDLLVVGDGGRDPRIISRIEELADYALVLVPPKTKHLRIVE